MTFEQTVFAWLGAKEGRDPALYSDLRMEASATHAWSEVTVDEFACEMTFAYDGEQGGYRYMNEAEAVEFLNEVWKVSNTGSGRSQDTRGE